MREVLHLCNRAVSEKTPQIFSPLLPTECMTAFSEQTEAPEVIDMCLNRQTDPTTVTLAAHARRGLMPDSVKAGAGLNVPICIHTIAT